MRKGNAQSPLRPPVRLTRRALATLAAILAVTAAAYVPSFSVPFQFDDYARISENWNLRAGNWLRGMAQLGGSRVVPAMTLAFNFWLSGEETWSYHAVNLAVHLSASAAVFWLAWLIAQTPRLAGSAAARRPCLFAGAATAVFACHPLQTQAVTYIIQRVAAMAALFYVAAVAAYVAARLAQVHRRGNPRARFAVAVVCAGVALLSKENTVSLPLAIALVEVTCFGRRHLRRLARMGLLLAPLLTLPVLWKLLAQRGRGEAVSGVGTLGELFAALFAQGGDAATGVGSIEYFRTQMLVLPRYLKLVVLPVGLNVDHDVRVASSLDGGVAAGAALLLVLLAAGCWACRQRPAIGLGMLWFFIALSVESSFLPIHDAMMEHRMYLAMPGPALVFAAGITHLATWSAGAAVAAVVTVTGVLAPMTYARNQVWQSALSLWSDAVGKSPDKARVHINVGVAYHGDGELDAAIAHYCRALQLDPEIAVARDNIEVALDQQGRLDDIIEAMEPRRVELPDAPAGSIVLEYDPSRVVCAEYR